ncbi:gliding motility-associated C-terminal domain-containing protein [Chitinophaga rupis]|uniref:Gliding motility-associated C-terminal domain-containing protein n=2 Tax=Chitinophaga rupis TaxID=573321 RepID=A0A1H7RLL6_9BACT|nr:gliding motility-associated C-terminal domain-containing protein [Chitinophaga rupis]
MKALYLLLAGLLFGFAATAQYTSTTINSGVSQCALAKDIAGNIYAVRTDPNDATKYTVVKYVNGAGAPVRLNASLQLVTSGIEYPWGLAVNSLGDVYVTNPEGADGWEIIKLTAPTYTATVIQSGKFYSSLAIDQNNDIITTEYIDPDGTFNNGDDKYRVVKYLYTNETGAGTVLYAGVPYENDFSYPWSIVVDGFGNIYFLDFVTNDPAPGTANDGGQLIKLTYPAYSASVINSGKGISTLALDASNNLYTVEAVDPTTSHVVKYSYPVTAGASGTAITPVTLVSAAGFYPWGMVIKGSSIFVNDATDDPSTPGDPADGAFKRLDPPTIMVNSVNRVTATPTKLASVQFTVTFSGSATGVTTSAFTLTTTGLTGASITSVSGSGTTYTVTVNTGTGDGTLRLDVNGTGISPTVSPAPFITGQVYTIDKTAPTTTITATPPVLTNSSSGTFTFTSNEAGTFEASLDGGPYTAATSPRTYTGLADGSHTFSVRAIDAAGNVAVTPASYTWTVDQTAPNTTITSAPPAFTNSSNATFTFISSEAGSTFQASLDGGPFTPVTSPSTYTGLADGSHTFSVRAIDPAGNTDATPDSYPWTIDQTAPTVTSVGVPANDYYHAGQNLDFTVNFSENVTVTGTPYINLTVGSTGLQAAYVSGSGTNALVFRYTVQSGDADADGVTLGTLALNGGTIQDAATNDANVTLNGVPSLANVRVNTTIPSVVLSTTASSPRNSGFTITLTFSEAVTGLSVADLNVLNTTVSNLQTADNITYTMDLQPSVNGVINMQLPANAVQNIGHNPNTASNTLSITYDAIAPVVTSVSVPANGYYKASDALTFTVNFSENITVAGIPQLSMIIGATPRQAAYVSGNGTNALTFTYTVQSGELDADGIAVTSLSANGGSLQDAATNNANLTLNSVGSTTGVLVDAVAPTVTSVAVPANDYYHNGQNLDFTVNFSENVTVTGTPYINLTVGSTGRQAAYVSGSGTNALVFRYTVQLSDADNDGIQLGTLALNGGPIQDVAGNNAVLTLNGVPSLANVRVNNIIPTVSITSAAPDPLNTGFTATITFSEAVTGLVAGDLTSINATASNLQTSDNITYTVDLAPAADGTVSLQVPGNAAENIGHNGNTASNTLTRTYDATAPTVTSVSVPANGYYKAGDALTFTVNFSENITVAGIPQLSMIIGAMPRQAAYVSGNGTNALTFTYTVQSGELDADGIAVTSLSANGGSLMDAATNNANLTLNSVGSTTGVLVDAVAPAVTSVGVPANGYYQTGQNLDFTVNFSENVTVTGTPTVPITIGSATVDASYISGSGTSALVFRYTVQAGEQDLDGISVGSTIALNGGTIRDAATNNAVLTLNSIGSTANVFVYSVVPGVTISTTAPALVNAGFTLTVTFTEAVTGFTASDITATNATVSNLATSDNITYTLDVTPAADGAVSLQVPASSAVNIAGNGNTASNTLSLTYDATAPVVTTVAVPPNGYYKTGGILNFTINFSENVTVTGTPQLSMVIGSTIRYANYISGSGTGALVFRYTVQNGEEDMNGITLGTLQLNGGTIKDAATNDAVLTLNGVPSTTNVRVHTAVPSVTLTTAAPALVNAPFTITATFSESMAGVALADFTVTNGTVSSLSGTANTVFTLTVTPTADGPVSITFPANKALNVAGTNNTASNTLSFTYDGTAPVITAVSVPPNGYYNATGVLSFTATFSENVTVTGTPQLGVIIGATTQQADYVSGSGTNQLTFSYTVQTGDNDMDGIALGNLTLNGGTIQDAATNNAVLTLNGVPSTAGIFVNTTAPTVVVSTTAVSPGNQPFTATFTFSEKVTGFTSSDIVVTNGAAGATSTSDNITYTALITPAADGTVTVQVPANVAVNIGNNGNVASNTITYTYDGTAPAITSVAVPPNGTYNASDVLNFIVNYDENVNVIGAGGIPSLNLTIGSSAVQAAYISGSGTNALTFSYTVQAGEQDLDGITIAPTMIGTMKDDAGNTASNTLNGVGNTSGVLVYTATPTVQLSGTVQANAPFTLTITFSEAVTGFTLSDITATNATLTNLNTTDNITYTALVTPVADGLVTLQVPANAAVNIVSNGNTASNTISYTYDATAPVITSVDVPANAYYTTGQNLDFTVHMSEAVNVAGGTPSIPVTIGATTVQANYVSGTGTNALLFRYTVLNGQMDMDGISLGAALALNGSTLRDPAGNNAVLTLNSVGSTTGVRVNTAHPTVVVATTVATRVNTAFNVTLTFSEAVTGLTTTGITATNATVSNLNTTDNITYTATITPVADGAVNVSVPANAAVNTGNNGNTASNTVTITYDVTAPVIANASFNVYDNSTAGTVVGTLTAAETAGTLQSWTLVTDGSGGAFALNAATGAITVKDAALLKTKAGQTFTLTVTVSDGLNTSAATPVTVKVLIAFINKAPTLDAIADAKVCTGTDTHTIQLTGASATEAGQTYTITAVSDQPFFDALSVNASNILSYKLKASVTTGTATITVTIKDNGGTDNGGVDTLRRSFTITVNELPSISISSDKGSTISKGDVIHLNATRVNGYTYSWSPADGILSGQNNFILEARPLSNITYVVTATTAAGCSSTANIAITVVEDFKVDAINILTPNGDGRNDKWVIRNLDSYPDNEVSIFDRTGRMIYHRVNYSNDWDATLNGSPLAEGTYYYVLKINGGAKTAKGYITIIRDQH